MWSDLYSVFLAIVRLRSQEIPLSRARIWFYFLRFKIKNRILKWLGLRRTTESFFGLTVCFADYNSFVYLFEEIFVQGNYYFHAKSLAPVILDCGSNIGLSVLYLKLLYPLSRILAFEPSRDTFALLSENIERNAIRGVELHNLALSDQSGEMTFYPEQKGSLIASVFADRSGNGGSAVSVPCQPLSDFVSGPVDFMKMDIEGAEALCIPEVSRARKLAQIREMVIECHHNLPRHKTILSEVLPVLEAGGYSYQVDSVAIRSAAKNRAQDVLIHAHLTESAP
jgi:FkbM family methyltransferase